MTGGNQLIPALLNRTALEDVEEHSYEVEYEDAHNNSSDCKEQRQISSPGGVKDPRVLKKYGHLGQESCRAIKD